MKKWLDLPQIKTIMTTKKLLSLLLLSIHIVTFAQVKLSKDFNVSVGAPYQVIDAGSKEYFSDGKGHTVSVKTAGKKITIQRYDVASMKELSRNVYEDFPPYNKLQKALKVGDKLFYVFSSFNKKEKIETLFSREVNMNNGTFESPKELFSTGSQVTVSSYGVAAGASVFGGFGNPIRFEVHKSFDNSKLLIRYRLKPSERNDAKSYDIIGFYVFNINLEKQWGGEVKMPYTEKQMNNLAYGISSDGKAYMLAFVNSSKQYELFNITSDLKVKTNKVDIDPNLFFQSIDLLETVDGNLTCIGYYANGVDYTVSWTGSASLSFNTNGLLYFKIDSNGKIISKYNFEFPLELINQYESKRAKEKNEKREVAGKAGINDLKLIDIALDADGNTTIIGEQQYIRKEFVLAKREEVNVYYYADMVITKFDKNGKLLWMKKLPKTQLGYNGKGGMSIRYIKGKDASYILYLDNVKNASIGLEDVPANHQDGKGGFLTAYKVDNATGAIQKHSIFDITDIKGTHAFQFTTPRIFDAMDKEFMLEVYIKGKEDTMVKMQLAN